MPPSRSWPSGPTLRGPSRRPPSSWEGRCATSTAARRLLPGLVTVGDAVATTTPTRGRGVAMACMQIEALLRLLDEGADPITAADPFDAWCEENIKPWVADHIAIDGGMVRRWQGEDIDLSAPLTSDLIADAVPAEPRIAPYAAGYFMMTALPATLQPAEPLARAVYERGWRPHWPRDRAGTSSSRSSGDGRLPWRGGDG